MRTIPVDTNQITFIGTGKAAARAEYVELSDGSRRRSGNQAKDTESGMPLWVVDVLVDDPDSDRAEVIGVKVAAWEAPVTKLGQPVRFANLVAVPYVDQRSGRVALSMRADGIEGAAPAAKAA
jgi:hypothetical protein